MEHAHAARCLEKLGNPTRLEIFRLIRAQQSPVCVCDIVDHFELEVGRCVHDDV